MAEQAIRLAGWEVTVPLENTVVVAGSYPSTEV